MAIDKSNSKPWVKVTVWVLTISLLFAFTAGGLIYFYFMILDSDYMRGSNSVNQSQMYEGPQINDDELRLAYEAQIAQYEAALEEDDSDTNRQNLAEMSVGFGSWLYQGGNVADYPTALKLFERALELDEAGQGLLAQQFIDQIKLEMGE